MFVFNQCEIPSITNQMSGLALWLFHCFSPSSGTYLLMVFESDYESGHHHKDIFKPAKQHICWKGKVSL
jgi:hypothetical protein